MCFIWKDYTSEYAPFINSWLDTQAISMTGIDQGWNEYWDDVLEDAKNFSGSKEYGKIVYENDKPIAVIAFGYYRGVVTISEIIVDPLLRGQGRGSRIIIELIEHADELIGEKIDQYTAVIYPDNIASQKAFEKAGFRFDYAHDDGDAWYYTLYTESKN